MLLRKVCKFTMAPAVNESVPHQYMSFLIEKKGVCQLDRQ